ncbi:MULTISPECIES: hypothetical protein [unclassified Mesorhizobium]|uniref:hypothetical protein n=1 Tax=unclassified Mesorhizobium TaxID=325217 RepID=UPI000FCAEEC5|nr:MULTISPECIES: hypothetical protein [unclassified Mesorhizobium]TGU56917.1 hypothetical protein EN791_029735 [Mesorhizobium sp. M2D.F.Ca.ET.148.01.1.1]TGU61298.1 hypothetical protein EN790_29755 [Mesorhizobium sp. M2D.F.Ca.ET.147.01.1.1]
MAIKRKERLAEPFSVRLGIDDLAYAETVARDLHLSVGEVLRLALREYRKAAARRALIGD